MTISDCFKPLYDRLAVRNTHNTNPTPTSEVKGEEKSVKIQIVEKSITPLTPKTPSFNEYWKERYEERAAILEFEGEMSRQEAEKQAVKMIEEEYHVQQITYH